MSTQRSIDATRRNAPRRAPAFPRIRSLCVRSLGVRMVVGLALCASALGLAAAEPSSFTQRRAQLFDVSLPSDWEMRWASDLELAAATAPHSVWGPNAPILMVGLSGSDRRLDVEALGLFLGRSGAAFRVVGERQALDGHFAEYRSYDGAYRAAALLRGPRDGGAAVLGVLIAESHAFEALTGADLLDRVVRSVRPVGVALPAVGAETASIEALNRDAAIALAGAPIEGGATGGGAVERAPSLDGADALAALARLDAAPAETAVQEPTLEPAAPAPDAAPEPVSPQAAASPDAAPRAAAVGEAPPTVGAPVAAALSEPAATEIAPAPAATAVGAASEQAAAAPSAVSEAADAAGDIVTGDIAPAHPPAPDRQAPPEAATAPAQMAGLAAVSEGAAQPTVAPSRAAPDVSAPARAAPAPAQPMERARVLAPEAPDPNAPAPALAPLAAPVAAPEGRDAEPSRPSIASAPPSERFEQVSVPYASAANAPELVTLYAPLLAGLDPDVATGAQARNVSAWPPRGAPLGMLIRPRLRPDEVPPPVELNAAPPIDRPDVQIGAALEPALEAARFGTASAAAEAVDETLTAGLFAGVIKTDGVLYVRFLTLHADGGATAAAPTFRNFVADAPTPRVAGAWRRDGSAVDVAVWDGRSTGRFEWVDGALRDSLGDLRPAAPLAASALSGLYESRFGAAAELSAGAYQGRITRILFGADGALDVLLESDDGVRTLPGRYEVVGGQLLLLLDDGGTSLHAVYLWPTQTPSEGLIGIDGGVYERRG